MYYKILKDGRIIDVSTKGVRFNKFGILVNADISNLVFLMSKTTLGKLYRAPWMADSTYIRSSIELVEAVEITEEEFRILYDQLNLGVEIESEENLNIPNNPLENDEESLATVLTASYLYEKIQSLETELAQQKQQNQLLEECILELSTELYN